MSNTALEAMKMVRDLADNAKADLGRNAGNGGSARPTIKQINNTMERLASIVKLMDEVVLPVYDLPPIPHASDIERKIAGKVVQCLLDEGFKITVLAEGDDEVIKRCEHAPMIFEAMASSSYDVLQVTSNPKSHRRNSFVQLVWGNGVDLISDYGMSLEEVLKPANDLAEALDDRG